MSKYSFRDAATFAAWLILAALALGLQFSLGVSAAPAVTGQAQALASHALLIEDAYIELEGVSAPDGEQICALPTGDQIATRLLARQRLAAILAHPIQCAPSLGHVGEARLVASCHTSNGDVAATMVTEGWLASSSSLGIYARLEDQAQAHGRGMWAETCLRG